MLKRKTGQRRKRRAAATVEMAVVTPLLLTMVFGIIEYGWISAVRQTLVQAAREGARTASLPGATDDQIYEQIDEVVTPLGLTGCSVELTRATPETPTEVVRVAIPYNEVTLVGAFFGSTDSILSATCVARREGFD